MDNPTVKYEFKVTHLIEVLENDLFPNLKGKIVKAEESEKEKGFFFYSEEMDLLFIPSRFVKVIQGVKSTFPFPQLKLMGFFIEKDKTIKLWVYNPSKEITPWELAVIVPYLMTSGTAQPLREDELDQVLPTWKKHIDVEPIPASLLNSVEYNNIIRNLR